MGVPTNGWFISWTIHPYMDALGVALFQEITICIHMCIIVDKYGDILILTQLRTPIRMDF